MGFKLTPDRLFPNNMSGQLTIPQLQVRPAYYSPITRRLNESNRYINFTMIEFVSGFLMLPI